MNKEFVVRMVPIIFGCAIATIGWIYLYLWDWKIAGSIMLVMWANNISIKYN